MMLGGELRHTIPSVPRERIRFAISPRFLQRRTWRNPLVKNWQLIHVWYYSRHGTATTAIASALWEETMLTSVRVSEKSPCRREMASHHQRVCVRERM